MQTLRGFFPFPSALQQFNLFGGTVLKLGTERHHAKLLKGIDTLDDVGCFGLTELGCVRVYVRACVCCVRVCKCRCELSLIHI